MGHAGRKPADGQHLLRLHHHVLQRQPLCDVIDADHHATACAARQRIKGQRVVVRDFIFDPGDPLDLGDRVPLDRVFDLRQESLHWLEGEEDRLIEGFIQRRAGEGAGLLVPLRDIQLFVERDQR